MSRLESRKKIVRLNETDRRVLLTYSDRIVSEERKANSEIKDKLIKLN